MFNGVSRTMQPYKEDKARRKGKGRRFCLGEEFIQFLATLAVLPIGRF